MEQFNITQFNENTIIEWAEKWPIEFDWYNLMSICKIENIANIWNDENVWNDNNVWNDFYTRIWTNPFWIWILRGNFYDLNNIDVSSFNSSLADWWWVYNKKYWNKQVRFTLFLQWENHEDLINRLDELKSRLQWVEKDFDILINEEYRTYKATITNITVPRFSKNDNFIEWIEVDMLITSPHWEIKQEKVNFNWDVVDDYQALVLNSWTYDSFPRMLFIFKNSWNAITKIQIESKWILETNINSIIISETISNNDILEVNYKTKQVLLNWAEVPFNWVMTPMIPWYNTFDFTFTWTVNTDITILYNKTFL